MASILVPDSLSVAAVDVVPVTIRWETSLAFGNDEVRR